jgi:hypothetical protein
MAFTTYRRTKDIDGHVGLQKPGRSDRRLQFPAPKVSLLRSALRGSADSVKTSDTPRLSRPLPRSEHRLARCRLGPGSAQEPNLHDTGMARASTASSIEVLAGLVERVAFHNDQNGFCVLRVKARGQRDLITVLGHAAMIAAGEFVQASRSWINDRTHGVQFKASFLKATAPTTTEGIEKYLGSGMIRGIGPVYAKKLVRAYGDAVFDIIQQERDRLRECNAVRA